MADRKSIPDELTITLAKPITMSGKGDETIYSEISLHEPNVSQLSQFIRKTQNETAVDAMKFLIHLVSGVPLPVLEKVGVSDFYEAMAYMTLWVSPPDQDDPEGNLAGSQ
ncbi:tail assembly chaperone E/41/14-like protein [Paraburkholderia sp. BL8N3]|nr:phage tail assembly protein [Paraburkholderia sp. BL8N3]TCK36728.1 tail assembly chaperone E/41/14-like protein [Paraburkholderia sp. BL8N3]